MQCVGELVAGCRNDCLCHLPPVACQTASPGQGPAHGKTVDGAHQVQAQTPSASVSGRRSTRTRPIPPRLSASRWVVSGRTRWEWSRPARRCRHGRASPDAGRRTPRSWWQSASGSACCSRTGPVHGGTWRAGRRCFKSLMPTGYIIYWCRGQL